MDKSCFKCLYFPNCKKLASYGTEEEPDRVDLLSIYGNICGEFVKK